MTGVLTGNVPTPDSIGRFRELKTVFLATGIQFEPEANLEKIMPGVKLAQQNGMKCLLWTNIRQAIDIRKHANDHYPAGIDYRNFPDCLIHSERADKFHAKGDLIRCWDGFSLNHSPELSYAKFQFARLTRLVTKYNLDGIFMDLFNDTIDSDMGRTYAQFPFYPLAVAETAFVKQLFTWCEQHQKVLNLNGTNGASAPLMHLCHSVTSDSNGPFDHYSMEARMTTLAAGKRHLLLPILLDSTGRLVDAPSSLWVGNGNRAMFCECRYFPVSAAHSLH
jgi:hypothetical protein